MTPDVPVAVGQAPMWTERRIIGVELRLVDRVRGIREEIALVPCDVRYPIRTFDPLELNVTVHTTAGDTTFPVDAVLPR